MLFLLLLPLFLHVVCSEYVNFLVNNRLHQCPLNASQPRLGLSYFVTLGYFENIPANERIPPGHANKQPTYVWECGRMVSPAELDAYEFQTEHMLTATGLNIYDGALRAMALALIGDNAGALDYLNIINNHATCQFPDVRGDAVCKGVLVKGTCPAENNGNCGFCYGDGTPADSTLPTEEAWTFRMIADYWALEGTVDQRCPEKGMAWTWNDYRPVLGENSWANLIAPLQVAFKKYGSVQNIPNDDLSINMAISFLPSLVKMRVPGIGGVYYAPKNTLSGSTDKGFDLSVENNISLLAGLKALYHVLTTKNIHMDKVATINGLITDVQNYIKSSYDPSLGYFRQGGVYNDGTYTWNSGPSGFAVDCQTWCMTVINPLLIDQWYGTGTAKKVWENTKKLGGYEYDEGSGMAHGLGFTENSVDQVLSGEWTLGAVNMLKVFANVYPEEKEIWEREAQLMTDTVKSVLTIPVTFEHQSPVDSIAYANKRYWIPFGWWANRLPSVASTAWAYLMDQNYNPFFLGGQHKSDY